MNKPKCTTHHLACDCREAYFRELEKQNKDLKYVCFSVLEHGKEAMEGHGADFEWLEEKAREVLRRYGLDKEPSE